MIRGAGWGFCKIFLMKTYIFLQKYKKKWIIIASEKTEITRGDCNIFLHLCTPEKLKKNLTFVQRGKVTVIEAIFIFKLYTFCIIFSFFIDFKG